MDFKAYSKDETYEYRLGTHRRVVIEEYFKDNEETRSILEAVWDADCSLPVKRLTESRRGEMQDLIAHQPHKASTAMRKELSKVIAGVGQATVNGEPPKTVRAMLNAMPNAVILDLMEECSKQTAIDLGNG